MYCTTSLVVLVLTDDIMCIDADPPIAKLYDARRGFSRGHGCGERTEGPPHGACMLKQLCTAVGFAVMHSFTYFDS